MPKNYLEKEVIQDDRVSKVKPSGKRAKRYRFRVSINYTIYRVRLSRNIATNAVQLHVIASDRLRGGP